MKDMLFPRTSNLVEYEAALNPVQRNLYSKLFCLHGIWPDCKNHTNLQKVNELPCVSPLQLGPLASPLLKAPTLDEVLAVVAEGSSVKNQHPSGTVVQNNGLGIFQPQTRNFSTPVFFQPQRSIFQLQAGKIPSESAQCYFFNTKMVFFDLESIFANPKLSFVIGKIFFDPKRAFCLTPQKREKEERERERQRDNGGDS